MSKSARNAPKSKQAKPAVPPVIEDKRVRPLRKWADEIITPFIEALEIRSDAIEGEIRGLRATRDGDPVLAINTHSRREEVVELRGGLVDDRRRLKVEYANNTRAAVAPSEFSIKQNALDLAKVERQIAAVTKTIKRLIAEKSAIDDMIPRIRRAQRRHGNMPCIRRAPEAVIASEETLSSLLKTREAAIDERVAIETGDKSKAEGETFIDESVDRVGLKAHIDLSGALDVDSTVKDIRLLFLSQNDPETNQVVERVPAFELVCALFPDAVKKHCKARLAKYHKDIDGALNAEQRAARIKQLRKTISELDWKIVAHVQALHAAGKSATYPKKISVWAVLGLQPQKEVRQFADRYGREDEL